MVFVTRTTRRAGRLCGLAACGVFLLQSSIAGLPAAAVRIQPDGVDVDLELILAVDVSHSMNEAELHAQRDGYVQAFRDPSLADAVASGTRGRIAVMYLEWAGARHQSVLVPWTIVGSAADAELVADALAEPPLTREVGTSISASLLAAGELFHGSRVRGERKVIDISGDGPNNSGPPLAPIREWVLARGITINGLPITLAGHGAPDSFASYPQRHLESYFEHCVIGGPNAFVVGVTDIEHFGAAILKKLVLEIAWQPDPVFHASHAAYQQFAFDCTGSYEAVGR